MIYENSIKLMDNRTFEKQVEDLSEGMYYLKDSDKWERQRKNNFNLYFNGKITAKEYTSRSVQLIRNVVSNIEKNTCFGSTEKFPF